MFAPVGTGVVKLDGSSEVNMVALEGDIRYLEFRVPTKASLNPTAVEPRISRTRVTYL